MAWRVHQRTAQLVLGLDALLHITALRSLDDAGTSLRHLREHVGFMGSIAFDSFHQIRNEVGTLLELHVNLRPAVF